MLMPAPMIVLHIFKSPIDTPSTAAFVVIQIKQKIVPLNS
jgi:hypothetical protein